MIEIIQKGSLPIPPVPPVSAVVYSGEVICDEIIRAIQAGENLDMEYFASRGRLGLRHLRLLVSKSNSKVKDVRIVAEDMPDDAGKAINFCVKPEFAKILLEVSKDAATDFSFYNQEWFTDGLLHDDHPGADAFRSKINVYSVLSEQILYGGNVLPNHVSEWYDEYGTEWCDEYGRSLHAEYMAKDVLMGKCYALHEKQFASTVEGEIVEVSPYEFMVRYFEYLKYLPIYLYIHVRAKQRERLQALVASLEKHGVSSEVIMAVSREALDTGAQTPAEKKRARKLTENTHNKEFKNVVSFVADAPKGVRLNVVGFLRI